MTDPTTSLMIRAAMAASTEIMAVYARDFAAEAKSDGSPVTEADQRAEAVILAHLADSGIPVLGEESVAAGIIPSLDGPFFVVDPLDGTKEFINRSGDFTVNIALVRNGVPVIGVVYAPMSRRFFSASPAGAQSIELDSADAVTGRKRISVRAASRPLTIVASRSHRTPETDRFIQGVEAAEIVSVGSSLKFCLLACGEADLYPRFGRTMEWDTAAGDAVLRAAGGSTVTLDGTPLRYGKRNQADDSDFANPHFIAKGGA